ncbi:MAG: type II toxin-antitoxin system death-on-curing family toxin [Gammaproteobacteria bacterium]|nr:type II toxin-antitoxin system death-on-curing family toxin [Gammaproteobacteria bacterium]
MFRWLSQSVVLHMHAELMDEHGGLNGPVNEQNLDSTLTRPQQLLHYESPMPSIFQLAASYGYGLAMNHCFRDGNKRISLVCIDVFLQINGYELIAGEADAVVTIESLASGTLTEEELTDWIIQNTMMIK